MTVLNFRPEVWSKVILAALQKKLVFGSQMVVNSDYEGEISGPGNTVRITQFGDPTISSYSPGGTITYQALNDAGLAMVIDQAKSFAFAIDDVDRRQAAGDMQAYLETRAAYRLADVTDQFIAGLYTGIAAANAVNAGGAVTPLPYNPAGGNYADFFIKVLEPLKVILDQNNVPDDGRYVTVPPWAHALLSQTQAFIAVTDAQGQPSQAFQRGYMGQVAGFSVLKSNNCPNPSGSNFIIQAGHPMAITFGEQIAQTEALRLQSTFADGVRGLHVYGAKMVRPDTAAYALVTRPAGI